MVLFLGGSQGGATVAGDALVVVVVGTWVGYLLTGRRARATVDVVDFMSTMMPIGVLTAAPVAIVLAGDDMWPLSAKGWMAVALLSVLTGMLGHGLIAFAQREVDVGHDRHHPGRPAGARRVLELPHPRRGDPPGPGAGHDPRHRRPGRVHDRQPATRPAASRYGGARPSTGSSRDPVG